MYGVPFILIFGAVMLLGGFNYYGNGSRDGEPKKYQDVEFMVIMCEYIHCASIDIMRGMLGNCTMLCIPETPETPERSDLPSNITINQGSPSVHYNHSTSVNATYNFQNNHL